MADRYQDRPFPDDRGDAGFGRGDDPLAELARLIGQSDPRGAMSRANQPVPPVSPARPRPASPPPADEFQQPPTPGADDGAPASGPLPWMQRANRQEAPQPDFPNAAHPLQRQAAPPAAPELDFRQAPPPFAPPSAQQGDPSRYDEALYGRLGGDAQDSDLDQPFGDDGYGYQEGYDDDGDDSLPRRRGRLFTVAAVLALVVVGTGAAFTYRSFLSSSRSGEPPIIRADASPTKIMPIGSDGLSKVPDRLSASDGSEKIVPREETPVDVDAQSGPRVVLPSLSQSGGLPPISSAAQGGAAPVNGPPANAAPSGNTTASAANGTLSSSEPRRIKTLSVRGDQTDGSAMPVAATVPPPARGASALRAAANAPRGAASAANANAAAPLSLVPQQAPEHTTEPRTRVAATNPNPAPASGGGGGGWLVQVSSQRNEADAQTSYKALQGKFPTVFGSRSAVIKRADLGEKGVYYRAMVGPFDVADEALQFCNSLRTAGGQCVIQRN
jgi:hypothetical protein